MVYDVTDQHTFSYVEGYLQRIDRYADEKVHKFLVGNKCDLVDDRKVTTEEAKDFADQHGLEFLETSAKDSTNVDEAFSKIATAIANIGLIN